MTGRNIRRIRGNTDSGQGQNQGGNDMIVSMAQGLAQAQANTNNQQDILGALNQISQQLSQLQGAALSNQAGTNQMQQANPITGSMSMNQGRQDQQNSEQDGQQTAQSSQANVVDELQRLFSQLLQNGQANQAYSPQMADTNLSQSQMNQQQGQMGQQQGQMGQQQGIKNQQGQQNQQQGKKQDNQLAVQTAAQVLSEAQYELSVELENSLQKLKQVISESEKLADKISKLLGEEQAAPKS